MDRLSTGIVPLILLISSLSTANSAECPLKRPFSVGGWIDTSNGTLYPNIPTAQAVAHQQWVDSYTSNIPIFCDIQTQSGSPWVSDADALISFEIYTADSAYPTDCSRGIWNMVVRSTFLLVDRVCPSGYSLTSGPTQDAGFYCKQDVPQSCPEPPHNPSKERGGCPNDGSQMVGNPCNAGTGNKFQAELDYAAPGVLRFGRYYNSDSATPQGSMGNQWRSEYDRSIVFSDNAVLTSQGNYFGQITALRADGKEISFERSGLQEEITPTYAGTKERLVRTGTSTFEFKTSAADVETYNVVTTSSGALVGRLESIRFIGGKSISFTYGASGDLLSVVDDFGKHLTFGYDSSGRISTLTDPAGGVFSYAYSGGRLTSVTYPDDTPGTSSDNPVRQYKYEDSGTPQRADLHCRRVWAYLRQLGVRWHRSRHRERTRRWS